jgi:hypothetical protein
MYKQTLINTIENHVKPALLKKNNRNKKWAKGYDSDHDMVIISSDGTIGEIVEIQNLKIALPAVPEDVYKCSDKKEEQMWSRLEYPKELAKIKSVFDWQKYPTDFKEEWYGYIDKEFEKSVVMECHISRTEGQVFRSWLQLRPLTWQQYQPTHALGFCPNLVPMQRRCSQIKWYLSALITRSSSNRYKTVWTDQRPNSLIEFQLPGLREENSTKVKSKRKLKVLIPPLTGKTQGTTRTTGKN